MEEELVAYLQDEVEFALQEQSGRRKKWDRWRRQREALPEFETKTYPFKKGSSNSVPPVAQVNTNNVYAGLNNIFGAPKPFWTVSAIRVDEPEDLAIASISTKYLDILAQGKHDLNKKKISKTIHYETGSLGLCMVKVAWTRKSWTISEDEMGVATVDREVVLHNGPEIIPIPAEDFLYREAYQDLQSAPWVGHVLHKTWPEIKQLGETGFYQNIDQIEEFYKLLPDENLSNQEAREKAQHLPSDNWDIHEFFVFWEVDGKIRDYVITMELESGIILRSSINGIGARLLEGFGYLIRPHRIEQIGVGQLSDHMQEECTMIHNARIDGIHVGVAPMFKARRNSGVKEGEMVSPGKIWLVDDPTRDIDIIKAPEPFSGSFQAEQMAFQYARQAVGQPEDVGGFANVTAKTRDSSGMVRQRLQQQGSVFASVTEGVEDSWGAVGEMVWLLLIHHKEEVIESERLIGRLTEKELGMLQKALDIPKDQVPIRLKFGVRTSDIEQTFETKRQNLLTRVQLDTMFFQQTMPMVQTLFGPDGQKMQQMAPELWKYMARMYTARCRTQEQILKFFGEDDTMKYIPDYKKLEALLDLQRMMEMQMQMMGGLPNAAAGEAQPALPAPQGGGAGPGGTFPGAGTGGPEAAAPGTGPGAQGFGPEPGMEGF
jgi:hypothetical protein